MSSGTDRKYAIISIKKQAKINLIFTQDRQPKYIECQIRLAVKYFLIECRVFTLIRQRFFNVNNMKDL